MMATAESRTLADELEYLESCGDDLEKIMAYRGVDAMPVHTAGIIARKVMLHLYRGSIEAARASLDEGWRTYVDDDTVCDGPKILEQPLSKMLNKNDVRLLNLLEQAGIMTVADLLDTTPADWLAIPSVGQGAVAKLGLLRSNLRKRAERNE